MKIGNLQIGGFACLAPMAGVADRAMREICIEFGAGYTVGELTSAKGVSRGDKKSQTLLYCGEKERPFASQLFGSDPVSMGEAAKRAEELSPDFIDINMGCPAPKVAGHGGGSALMKNPVLAGQIISAVVEAVNIPVTVKMRSGWDNDSLNAVEIAKIAEQCGASAVTVHGRTRTQMYAPPVNIDIIAQVKKAVNIPVIANGDITDFASAKEMKEKTGCDYLCVGRGAMGNPFVFSQINAGFSGEEIPVFSLEERLNVFRKQVALMIEYKGERTAFLESRKHASWYIKGIRGAAGLRRMCGEISSIEDIDRIIEKALESQQIL
ncbi:MAG: tRNA dihydrouridine synthase DusB [Acutalibacteraceae bacterium]|nr:tRNA dihydrouridine synthase DusB [Acutalibacteraceae bacterium]